MKKIVFCLILTVSLFADILLLILHLLGKQDCLPIATDGISIKELASFLIATIGISLTWNEYLHKVDRDNALIWEKYNERFLSDETIRRVERYLCDKMEKGHNTDSSMEINLSNIDKEKYMRFFEEIQYLIDAGVFKEKQIHDLFGYYTGEIDKMGKDFVSDYSDHCWDTFRKFAKYHNKK